MALITLRGNPNVGKSETLNYVYQYMLLFGYTQVASHFTILGNPINKDFRDILERKGIRIGIATMGDYETKVNGVIDPNGDRIQDLIAYFQNHNCNVIICACNSNLNNAISFIQSHNSIFVDKTIDIPVLHRIRNGEDAEKIYKLI